MDNQSTKLKNTFGFRKGSKTKILWRSLPLSYFWPCLGCFIVMYRVTGSYYRQLHVLCAPLALCFPLILHWTVRMDFAVLSQLEQKRLSHMEMPIRFPPPQQTHSSHKEVTLGMNPCDVQVLKLLRKQLWLERSLISN